MKGLVLPFLNERKLQWQQHRVTIIIAYRGAEQGAKTASSDPIANGPRNGYPDGPRMGNDSLNFKTIRNHIYKQLKEYLMRRFKQRQINDRHDTSGLIAAREPN